MIEAIITGVIVSLIVMAITQAIDADGPFEILIVLAVFAGLLLLFLVLLVLLLFVSQWLGWFGFVISLAVVFGSLFMLYEFTDSILTTLLAALVFAAYMVLNGYVAYYEKVDFFIRVGA